MGRGVTKCNFLVDYSVLAAHPAGTMNAALTTTTSSNSTLDFVRTGLLALGFKAAVKFGNGGYDNEISMQRDGVLYSVRAPKGAKGFAKLVFEINVDKWRNSRSSWARLDVLTETDWVEAAGAWMAAEHPKALARAAREEAEARRDGELRDRAREVHTSVYEALVQAGHGSKYPVVKHDGTKIVCAQIIVDVRGENAEELTRRMLALLAEYEYKSTTAVTEAV